MSRRYACRCPTVDPIWASSELGYTLTGIVISTVAISIVEGMLLTANAVCSGLSSS